MLYSPASLTTRHAPLSSIDGKAARGIPVVVVTARDLSAEDHHRLNGSVERILKKGAYRHDALLAEVRRLVMASVGPRPGAQAERS